MGVVFIRAPWKYVLMNHFCRSIINGFSRAALLILMGLTLQGCLNGRSPIPDRLRIDPHAGGDAQAGVYGQVLPKALRVELEGPQVRGMLGGVGSRSAVPDITVRFEMASNGAASFEGVEDSYFEVQTNSAGAADAFIRLGNLPGDVMVKAYLPKYPEIKPVLFRCIVGVERIGSDLEGPTGGVVDDFGVRLLNTDGTPAVGVDVFFRTEGDGKSSLKPYHILTDEQGEAVASWKLGSEVRQYFSRVEILDERLEIAGDERFHLRALDFEAMATDKTRMFMVLLGGLAIFIFGMKMMSDGLQKVADKRLRQVLNFMTQNRFMAIFAGTAITAMVQSSSATTVLTVGFVNAGLMNLSQAIGVIFGANIGTTVTAQIIAFKLNALAYPAAAVGLVLIMASKTPRMRALGETILGFGLLFLGMSTMSAILKPLRHSPGFMAWFQMFDCTPGSSGIVPASPAMMCIMVGTIATVLVQSSSATVGLVLALASQGVLNFYTAFPLLLGSNIGTTVTAVLSCIGTNRNAQRTALAHALFNVLGSVYMYSLLFLPLWNGKPVFLGFVDAITAGDAFAETPENLLRHVANAHSAFNIVNCLLFLPFVGILARICQAIIPIREEEQRKVLRYLEPKLLQTPSIALQQAVKEVTFMVRQGEKSTEECVEYFKTGKASLEVTILRREEELDRLQHDIAAYLVRISRAELSADESALMPALLHAVNDAERLGDHAEEMVELYHLLAEHDLKLPGHELDEISELSEKLGEQFTAVFRILEGGDVQGLEHVRANDKSLSQLIRRITDGNVKRIEQGACDVQAGVIFLDAVTHLERVGGHLLNIAERAVIMVQVAH
jgi:phosphate:Na+ symporter